MEMVLTRLSHGLEVECKKKAQEENARNSVEQSVNKRGGDFPGRCDRGKECTTFITAVQAANTRRSKEGPFLIEDIS